MKRKEMYLLWFLLLLLPLSMQAKQDSIKVSLKTNIKKDKIQLRWAVGSSSAWYYTNKHGFVVERLTLLRDSVVLSVPEKVILTPAPLLPKPLNDWQEIAQTDNYAAIIAQALYGSSFEVSGGNAVSQIIALSQEQEQRYAMSLLAADRSYSAALFAGWGLEDTSVKAGERYLYRVIPANISKNQYVETDAAYVGLSDYEELPRPIDLNAVWGNASVLLTWNYNILLPYYNGYYVERSENGTDFKRLSGIPQTNISGTERMFYTDSIVNNKTYHYRIVGINPFGDESPASEAIEGKGANKLIYVPFIKEAIPDGKAAVDISWEFDERGNSEIASFELRQSLTVNGEYKTILSNIDSNNRRVTYHQPESECYLVVAAIPQNNGKETVSLPHFLQLQDSIPPAIPVGLRASVDTLGVVRLSWNKNQEIDLLGYRIYRAQTKGEEFIPLNDIAYQNNEFTDTITIYNLNPKVYYAVASIDKRYNQSLLSEMLEVEKPEVIKPSSPFISKYEAIQDGISLSWQAGRDERVKSFKVYRQQQGGERNLIKEVMNVKQNFYTDSTAIEGITYIYAVTAVTKQGLESNPSLEVTVKAKQKISKSEIQYFKAQRTTNAIILYWQHIIPEVKTVTIYRKENENPMILLQEVNIWEKQVTDSSAKQNTSYEYLLVVKDKSGKILSKNYKVK